MSNSRTEMACSLDEATLKSRRVFFRERLLPQAVRKARIDTGLQIVFVKNPDLRDELLKFIGLEQQCCGFLEFELTEDPENSRLQLSVTGPPEAQATLDQMESVFVDGDTPAKSTFDTLMKRTGLAGVATGVMCLFVCELPVLLGVIGLGGLGAWLMHFQPTPVIEAAASVAIFAGATLYVVWRRRTRHTRPQA